MKTSKLVLLIFLFLGVLFVVGSFFDIPVLYTPANYLLVPSLLIYYLIKVKKIFWPVVAMLVCFYIRDLLMMYSLENYIQGVMVTFVFAMILWYLCVITRLPKSPIQKVEIMSLVIMYSFLGFLTYSMSEVVTDVIPSYSTATYFYLFILNVLVAITFTKYILKSHWASLWLMIASAALLVSEISLFFKLYIIEDLSVNIFYPTFHLFMFYCLVQFGIHRRKTGKLWFF
ncbi:hypothetical protein [Salinimicrobium marinum]|uniref:hypothetical protein n=1 Tax=Salinimicrobium marinum TaxID=680283 RepID=UPI001671F977|nr:hypothetical protein [Salinimicrobium marinum]